MMPNLDACLTWRSFLSVSLAFAAAIIVVGALGLAVHETVRHVRHRR